MTLVRLSSQAPGASGYDHTTRTLPLLQRHETFRDSATHVPAGSTSTWLVPGLTNTRRLGNQGAPNRLAIRREQLVRLFWEQDLTLREVQQIMKEEHGLDVSIKVYKTQFRNWGIRKNLKGHEALNIASGQGSSTAFWPENRVDDYVARIDRHVKSKNPQKGVVLRGHAWTTTRNRQAMNPARTLEAPDALRKLEASIYHLHVWFAGCESWKATWFVTGPSFREQDAFSYLFVAGLERLSRNDQPQLAFRDINLAFDRVKQLVSRDHPLVYMHLISSICAFSQYPKSEVCSTVCRTLSDFVGKVTGVVHGPHHPLNHFWGESLHISSMNGPESFSLGAAAQWARRCMPHELRIRTGSIDIAKWVPSEARGLDEASLRQRVATMASRPNMLSEAQEARLALCELLAAKLKMTETIHFFAEARVFQDADPLRRASKMFWMAELEWRSGNAKGSINALNLALEFDDITAPGEMNIEFTGELKREIESVLRDRQNMMASEDEIEGVTRGCVDLSCP